MRLDRRTIALVATAMLAAATVLFVQGRFEVSDENAALALVKEYRSRAGVSVPELLAYHHPEHVVAWTTGTESACFQHIRVEATVGAPAVVYAFAVDINGPSIHPANEEGKRLLGEIDAPLPTTSAGSATAAARAPSANTGTADPSVP